MARVIDRNRRTSLACNVRILLVLLFSPMLTACFATTDSLAVFENNTLSQKQVDALIGYHHLIDNNGNFASLEIKPRTESWPYKQERLWLGSSPFFPQNPQQIVATNIILKSGGAIAPYHYEGAAVFPQPPKRILSLSAFRAKH